MKFNLVEYVGWAAGFISTALLLLVMLLRGRWRPADAKRDEQEHEAMVEAELAKLSS